jgi:hypothetical protein
VKLPKELAVTRRASARCCTEAGWRFRLFTQLGSGAKDRVRLVQSRHPIEMTGIKGFWLEAWNREAHGQLGTPGIRWVEQVFGHPYQVACLERITERESPLLASVIRFVCSISILWRVVCLVSRLFHCPDTSNTCICGQTEYRVVYHGLLSRT